MPISRKKLIALVLTFPVASVPAQKTLSSLSKELKKTVRYLTTLQIS